MARLTYRLTAIEVEALKRRGLYPDGDGLYLRITSTGTKSWIYRYSVDGRLRDMGLGPLASVSLAKARKLAAECRRQRSDGGDPIKTRKTERAAQKLALARTTSFKECAERLIAAHEAGWRNAKHRQQWRSTLGTYAYPVLGHLPVGAVDTGLVMEVLEAIWTRKPETAGRVRGRIEAVLNWAKANGLRSGENPAAWRGHLDQLLPARSKVRRVEHHPAIPYGELPAFMQELRARDGISARALEFTILTASRTGEAMGARWEEINLEQRMWMVAADRMKSGREHRVPLARRAIAIIKEMTSIRQNDFVFPGWKLGRPLSNMALLMLLRDMRSGLTVHGFRSTFKDWCAEATHVPNFVSEAALAHVVADKVESAYRRSDLFEKRRKLMEAWAAYCARAPASGKAVPLERQAV
jgi:integrase